MQDKMETIPGGVTAAQGFEAAAAAAGIKYENRTDMAMIYSRIPCVCAGTFTSNVVKAAPVLWDRAIVRKSRERVHAVVINSGIANACTGKEGLDICRETAGETAAVLGIPQKSVLIGSTGVIGMQIPMGKVKEGIAKLASSLENTLYAGEAASRAIMTTDTVNKQSAIRVLIGEKAVTIGGMAKGSGMIHPGMCTMLAYVTSDVAIEKSLLQKAVSEVADSSFNMISVDGDMSTNDTLLVLSNGLAGNPLIDREDEAYACFKEALCRVCTSLAMQMAADGEGATTLIESRIVGADTLPHARTLAKSVIQSNLTKAAVYGRDANWGRILCALGYAGVDFDPENVDLYFEAEGTRMKIFSNGRALDYSEEEATRLLTHKKVIILCDMHMGEEKARAWGCDLTYDYVKINADYRS